MLLHFLPVFTLYFQIALLSTLFVIYLSLICYFMEINNFQHQNIVNLLVQNTKCRSKSYKTIISFSLLIQLSFDIFSKVSSNNSHRNRVQFLILNPYNNPTKFFAQTQMFVLPFVQ